MLSLLGAEVMFILNFPLWCKNTKSKSYSSLQTWSLMQNIQNPWTLCWWPWDCEANLHLLPLCCSDKELFGGNSQVVQRLGLGAFTGVAQVQSLVRERRSWNLCGAEKKNPPLFWFKVEQRQASLDPYTVSQILEKKSFHTTPCPPSPIGKIEWGVHRPKDFSTLQAAFRVWGRGVGDIFWQPWVLTWMDEGQDCCQQVPTDLRAACAQCPRFSQEQHQALLGTYYIAYKACRVEPSSKEEFRGKRSLAT